MNTRNGHPQSSLDGRVGDVFHLHVDDVDDWTNRAVAWDARLLMAPTDQFYGERSSKFVDPFGHEWMLGSSIEEVSPQEMQRRFTAVFEYPSSDGSVIRMKSRVGGGEVGSRFRPARFAAGGMKCSHVPSFE